MKLMDRDCEGRRVSLLVNKYCFTSGQELLLEVSAGPSQPISEKTQRTAYHEHLSVSVGQVLVKTGDKYVYFIADAEPDQFVIGSSVKCVVVCICS